MAKQSNPFLNFDVTKMMADFDPSKMADEFTKFASNYKLPAFDVESVMASQRKNIEALAAANKAATEGMQNVATRQAAILQETLDEATKSFANFGKAGDPSAAAAKQAELYQAAFEKALANMSELADMVAKSSNEATTVVNQRISDSLDEIKALSKKSAK
ncbi:MAG: TIGR01841 family phasin [Rhodospirillaceae bacterium]|nr:TIGR01841 family phasin [Rhodospirillaceae bacterium]MBL6930104.1 TIGR01841 family phasin [Rhodospirillales bacterium]MBL6940731.1 TIGR01841 family phasin [Rhodospirillales bacterium]